MGYPTEAVLYPNDAKVKSHIQSYETAMFYEVAHGGSDYFENDCSGNLTTATDIHNWIKDYPKMPFTFLASCFGMCEIGSGTLSYEFRKGSTEDTVTVGTCLGDPNCTWELEWQDAFFNYMSQGWTVKEAFDKACILHNKSAPCVRFAGDENFKVVPKIGRVSLGEAVDNTDLSWGTGGDGGWFGQANTYYYDGDAAESGDISDGESTYLETTVTGSGDLSFYWKVDSELGYDYLRFYIDGAEQAKISGSTSWAQKTYSIDSGSHTLTWKYTKDGSISSGEDCGWVDKVEFTESLCAAESAVRQASVPDPEEVLNPLRELRDDSLKDDYVACYYEYSPDLVKVMAKDPALAYETATLLVNHSPMVEHYVKTKGISEDKPIIITERDVEEVVSYVERLKRSMLANREEIGTGRCQEIVKLLDEFKQQVEASVGKTFTEALRDSVYYKSKGVIELNVTPAVVVQGETVSITGKALPNEPVWLKSSFALSLPVSDGVYSRDFTGIHLPAGNKSLFLTAEDVKDIKIIFEAGGDTIEYYSNVTDGIFTIFVPETDIPPGKCNITVCGNATDGATSVKLTTNMSIKAISDSNGDFSLNVSTESVPIGEYPITAGGIEKTVLIVSALVHNCEELQNIKNLSGTCYVCLARDIDCSDTVNWNSGAGFEPIGNSSNPFTGTFDGGGHKITNLYINRPSTNNVGLFGRTGSGSEIRNVGLEDVDIKGNERVGGLVGQNRGNITNSYSTGSVTGIGLNFVGGLVGHNYDSGTIENCYFYGSVSGQHEVGGLVGSNEKPYGGTAMPRILRSYSMGSVTGTGRVGGLVGLNYWDGEIINSYSHSSVSGESSVIGGLIGEVYGVTVINSYSTGQVTGSGSYVGGLIGYKHHGTIIHSYWDIETSGQTTSGGGEGKTTAEMKQQATFIGWDFTDIWDIIEGVTYPYLRWEEAPVLWTRYSSRIDNETQCLGVGGIAVDSEDNVIIASNRDIIKYDPNGNVLWEYDLCGCGVAVDKTDDSVVVGLCNSSIIKFSKTGSILWIEEL